MIDNTRITIIIKLLFAAFFIFIVFSKRKIYSFDKYKR